MIFKRALLKAGIFHLTFSLAFFLTYFFTPDPPRPVKLKRLAPPAFNVAEHVSAETKMVIMDRANKRGYTRLRLLLYGGRPAPERLRARTYFFLPGDPARRVWVSERVEIERPFAEQPDATLTVAASCAPCDDADAPHGGYFARVQLYADDGETPLPDGAQFFNAATAVPVIVNVAPARAP
ncbi:MAG TPA: hypothetical protein VF703_18130 [Pyrinomonadaceae bacterium]|jgi:hypothetical protein